MHNENQKPLTSVDEVREEHTIDKSGWLRGPWIDEPDRVEWRDKATGLPCMLRRVEHGHLCGYVAVPPGHPWHGVDMSMSWEDDHPEAHGGITFASECSGEICHAPMPGEEAAVWWLGFDAAHAFDYCGMTLPAGLRDKLSSPSMVDLAAYKNQAYMMNECATLAAQVAAKLSPPDSAPHTPPE